MIAINILWFRRNEWPLPTCRWQSRTVIPTSRTVRLSPDLWYIGFIEPHLKASWANRFPIYGQPAV